MAMAFAAGTTAVQIGYAVAKTIICIKKMSNDHDERLTTISNEHEETMTRLSNETNKENNKHEEFMELMKMLHEVVCILGNEICNAEYEGCKGLPGDYSSKRYAKKRFCGANDQINHDSALVRSLGKEQAMQIYETYQLNLQKYNCCWQKQLESRNNQ